MSGSGRPEPPVPKETDEAARKKFDEIRIGLKCSQTSDQSRELALAIERGLFVRNLVLKVADEALDAADRENAEAKRIQKLQEEFLSSFDAFVFDSQIPKSSRPAALGAILNALFIGLFSDDPDRRIRIIREFEQQRAAWARKRAWKSLRRKREDLGCTGGVQATAIKPKLSEKYAKLIQPKVIQLLGENFRLGRFVHASG